MCAKATPIETATPTAPNEAASEAAPAKALIEEESSAVSVTLSAWIPAAPSPSTKALIFAAIRFSVLTPAPLSPTPTVPPETATDPAKTTASIDCRDVAVKIRSSDALTLESST